MSCLFFVLALFFFQLDERAYEIAKEEVEFAVDGFAYPNSSVGMPLKPYWEAAIQASDMVLDFEPSRLMEGRYLFFSGMKMLHEGHIDTAVSDFTRSARIDPNEAPLAHYGLALAYSYIKEFDKAEAAFLRAAELWPHWARPHAALAALYMDSSRLIEAEEAIRKSLLRTEAEVAKGRQYFLLAQLLQTSDSGSVERILRRALAADPQDVLLYEHLGLFLFQQRRQDAAMTIWQQGLALVPSYSPIKRAIAMLNEGVQIEGSSPLESGESILSSSDDLLVGGTRFRAYTILGNVGERLGVRVKSSIFEPRAFLLSPAGLLLAVHDIRASNFSEINYSFEESGRHFVIVTSQTPGAEGRFKVEVRD